ncbi:MAG: M48 family metalloprotease [Leptolyngbyaceae cyanobacterium bins.59]|nr:M48 family metalloprotease [Leptolyngbyaceae cyanobacterium bins.59]
MNDAVRFWRNVNRRLLPAGLAALTCGLILVLQPAQILSQTTPPPPVISPEAKPTPGTETPTPVPDLKTPGLSPEEAKRQQKLMEADRLYLSGQIAAATALYREAKPAFRNSEVPPAKIPEPFSDPALLPPAGKVYWREAEAGRAAKLETRTLVPLRLLVQQYPQFIPGVVQLAQVLKEYKQNNEALTVLERAASLYPNQADLIRARVTALGEAEKWMEASIAARQFAVLYPSDPAAPEFQRLADENLQRFKSATQERLTGNTIANFITGALGFALTGSLYGPFSAVQTTILMLQGETGVGEQVAREAKQQLKMVEDPAVVGYVNEVGQKITTVAGRNDFKYEFHVVLDDRLNAFALPGGKIFVNAGAIKNTNSEAELAGLLAHEVSHAVLSHGFQLVTEGTLLDNVTQFIPLGGVISQLFVLDYSREMERQADLLGTRILVAKGYAADGLRNLMIALKKEEKSYPFSWLTTHPVTDERIAYLEALIESNGYNRYAYEGVEKHNQAKTQVIALLNADKQQEKKPQ